MNSKKFSFDATFTIANLAVVILTLTYLSGYLILRTFTGTIGLPTKGLIGPEFLEAGVFFVIFTTAVVAFPVVLWLLLRGLNRPENNPGKSDNSSIKWMTSGSNIRLPLVLVSNLCYVMLFFAVFATKESLSFVVDLHWLSFSLSTVCFGYIFSAIILFLVLGFIRLALREKVGPINQKIIKTLRFIVFVILISITLFVDLTLLIGVPVVIDVLLSAHIYLLMLVLLWCIVAYGIFRIRHLTHRPTKIFMIGMVVFFSVMVVYFALITYGASLYPNMPENRGGKYPLTQVSFLMKKEHREYYKDLCKKGEKYTVPLFLLDIQGDWFFCSLPRAPFENWNRKVIILKKEHIVRFELTRNSFLNK